MSETPPAPGWWQASDGNWYAPELHPDAVAAATEAPATSVMSLPTFGSELPAFGSPLTAFGSPPPAFGSGAPAFATSAPTIAANAPGHGSEATFAPRPSPYLGGTPSNGASYRPSTPESLDLSSVSMTGPNPSRGKPKALIVVVVVVVALAALYGVNRFVLAKGAYGPISVATSSTAQDRAAQVNLQGASLYLEGWWAQNNSTFAGISPSSLAQNQHDQLHWVSGSTNSGNDTTMSVTATSRDIATVAALSGSGICWFTRVFMIPPAPGQPSEIVYAGQTGGQCNAESAPVGWEHTFPPAG